MGSPISSLFADIEMEDYETECLKYLKSIHNYTPLWLFRYVDDLLLCIHKSQIDNVLNIFNSYHPRLNFTH